MTPALEQAIAQSVLRPFQVVGDAIPVSLTGVAGDPGARPCHRRKRESTCLLCHSGPFPEGAVSGRSFTRPEELAPAGRKGNCGCGWSMNRLNSATIMPSYYRVEGLNRVAPAWRGKPILSAEQIEDVVAYLATLRE